ncbi:MAG: HOG (high osmolarity glycerol) pathway protein, partial [Piccolia ochrophora]
MAAVQSVQSSDASPNNRSPPPLSALPPLVTSAFKRPNLQRTSSSAKDRLSMLSNAPNVQSRPMSHVFPLFHTSLSYALVRDFAYPSDHPLHYGPPPEPSASASGTSTPDRRLSDPARASWDTSIGGWSAGPWGGDGMLSKGTAPSIMFQDGPPWTEDDDLHSPIVSNPRHKKHKSSGGSFASGQSRGRGRGDAEVDDDEDMNPLSPQNYESERGYYAPTRPRADSQYSNKDRGDDSGVEYANHLSRLAPYNVPGQRDSHFAATLPSRSYVHDPTSQSTPTNDSPSPSDADDQSRYSRDYQFTIASADEEMHGKAVALFDFERENENELPLVEGQVIWVSYRHGQGWLVAEDPKTRENGLVPEEYVRLLRDIRGGWGSLTSEAADTPFSPQATDTMTPTQASEPFSLPSASHSTALSNGSGGSSQHQQQHHPPIVSTFSTSSKDLDPYPSHLLSPQHQPRPPQPPEIVHYQGQPGRSTSQSSTPTTLSPAERDKSRSTSGDRWRSVPEEEDDND